MHEWPGQAMYTASLWFHKINDSKSNTNYKFDWHTFIFCDHHVGDTIAIVTNCSESPTARGLLHLPLVGEPHRSLGGGQSEGEIKSLHRQEVISLNFINQPGVSGCNNCTFSWQIKSTIDDSAHENQLSLVQIWSWGLWSNLVYIYVQARWLELTLSVKSLGIGSSFSPLATI